MHSVKRDVVLCRLQRFFARPGGRAVVIEDITSSSPQEVQPDEQVLPVAVIVEVKRERRDIRVAFFQLLADANHVFPGLGRFRDQVFAVEHGNNWNGDNPIRAIEDVFN